MKFAGETQGSTFCNPGNQRKYKALLYSTHKRQKLVKVINGGGGGGEADGSLEKSEVASNGKLWKCSMEEVMFGIGYIRFGHTEMGLRRTARNGKNQ